MHDAQGGNMTKTDETVQRLTAALEAHRRAKIERRPEDNPFVDHDLKAMTSAGLRKSADKYPARNMAVSGESAGYELEAARIQALATDKADKSAKRMATARARAARKVEFDKIANSPTRPDPERMREAWLIVAHLLPTITRIANGKRRWAGRFLGDVADDVAGAVMESMALMLAKSDKDLDVLVIAAGQIGEQARRTGQIPGDQLSEEERKERKRIGKARKWLMQVVNNRVMDTMIDVYFRSHNLKWDNIDLVATVMANINGVGDDPMTARFKADRAPAFLGTKFPRPGGIDPHLLATAINSAITEKGLDRMVELLLANIRTDGAFPWSEKSEEVFMSSPTGEGEWMWQQVVRATEGRNRNGVEWTMERARKARGDAARAYVRQEFGWLPGFIVSTIDAFDPQFIGWSSEGRRAVLASEFELFYLPDPPEVRTMLQPRLQFADATEAALALIEHLSALVTGEDLVRSVANA